MIGEKQSDGDFESISIVKTYSLKDSSPSCSSGIPLEVLGDNFPDNLRLPRGAKSHYWKYFGLKPVGMEIDKTKVYCKLCRSALAYHGSTTCLSQHLFHMHQEQYMECHRAKQVRGQPSFLPPLPISMAKNRERAKAAREYRARLRRENATAECPSNETVDLTAILKDLCWMLTVPGHDWNDLVHKRRQTPEDVVVSLVKSHQRLCDLCISHREEQLNEPEVNPSTGKAGTLQNENDEMMSIELEEEKAMPVDNIKKELPDPDEDMVQEVNLTANVKVKEEAIHSYNDTCAICRQTFSDTCVREADVFKDVLPESGVPIMEKLGHIVSSSYKDPLESRPTSICKVCFEDLRKMDAIECDLRERHQNESLKRDSSSDRKLEKVLNTQTEMLSNQRRIMRQQKTLIQMMQSFQSTPAAAPAIQQATLLQPLTTQNRTTKSNFPLYTVIYGKPPSKSNG